MNRENFSPYDPGELDKEILDLPAIREEKEQKCPPFGELSLGQKKVLAEEMGKYCEKYSIPYNRLDFLKTNKEVLDDLGGVFLDALLRTGISAEKIGSSVQKLRSIVDRGLKLREVDFQGVKNEIGNWENKYNLDFKYQDYIGPLAINYQKISEIKERNQYLEPNLLPEKNFSKEIKDRQVAFNELFDFLANFLTKSQNISIRRDSANEEKATILRSAIFNFVKSGKPTPLIYPDKILQADQSQANELIWQLKGKDIHKIDSQKWKQMESLCDDLYHQLINRINPFGNEIKSSLEKKDFRLLTSINRRVLAKYAFLQIPEIITRPDLIEMIPERYQTGNLWQEGKYITINNFKIPHLDALKQAQDSIIAKLSKADLAKEHPDLIRIKGAISSWEKYQKNLHNLEANKNQSKKEIRDISLRLREIEEKKGNLTKKESDEILDYQEEHPDKELKFLLEKFNEAKKTKYQMEINLDHLESIKENVRIASSEKPPKADAIRRLISMDINHLYSYIETLQTKKLTKIKKTEFNQKIPQYLASIDKRKEQLKEIDQGISDSKLKEIWDSIYSENRYKTEKAISETINNTKKYDPKELEKYFSKDWLESIRNLLKNSLTKRIGEGKKTISIGNIQVSNNDEAATSIKKYLEEFDINRIELIKEILDSPFAYEIQDKITIREYLETILRIIRYANFQYNKPKIIGGCQSVKSQMEQKLNEIFIVRKTKQLEIAKQKFERIESGKDIKTITDSFIEEMHNLKFTLENKES